jgi:hypothetical protein
MPGVGFEPKIPVFERALDHAAIVISYATLYTKFSLNRWVYTKSHENNKINYFIIN